MATMILFGLISLVWAGTGLAMAVAPASWNGWVRRCLVDPLWRFLMTQGLLLAGLTLVLGATGHRGRWLWVAIGSLGVVKALILLGLTDSRRESLLLAWERTPLVVRRLAGVVTVTLATLLAVDTIRGPK
jgi:hypothetical protein